MTTQDEHVQSDDQLLARLVGRARAGDNAAMELLATRALTRARTVTRAVLHPDDALDVAQDAVVEALRALPNLREPAAFDAWVTRIAARRVLKARLQRKQRPPTLSLEQPGISEGLVAIGEASDGADARELRDALRVAIRSLPRDQGLAIALRYLFDLSEDQVGQALGKKTSTASVLLVRARRNLARHPAIAAHAPTGMERTP